jgi:Protein kinase domain
MNGRNDDNEYDRLFTFSVFDGPSYDNVGETTEGESSSIPSIPSIQTGGVGGGGGGGIHFGEAAAVSFAAAAASAASPLRPERYNTKSNRKHSSGDVDCAPTEEEGATSSACDGVGRPSASSAAASAATNATVPDAADQERQILLLVLLAQVCAMHDATPRTFTVHVLDLYERGLLDRESIQFLFELGLVPSVSNSTPGRGLIAANSMACNKGSVSTPSGVDNVATEIKLLTDIEESVEPASITVEEEETALTSTKSSGSTIIDVTKQKRIIETKAIRRQLSLNDQTPDSAMKSTFHEGNTANDDNSANTNPTTPATMHNSVHDNSDKPWEVEHFPLSLSRYQREFREVKLLNKGSFGHVFHCVRLLDGCDYAIKKIAFDARGYESKNIQRVMREVECLASVSDHPNVVHYYTSWLEPSWMTGKVNNNDADGHRKQHQKRRQQQRPYLLEAGTDSGRRDSPSNRLLRDLQNLVQHTNNTFSSAGGHDDESSLFDRRGSDGVESVGEDSWDSYQSHSLEPFGEAMDGSEGFSWDKSSQEFRRTSNEGMGTHRTNRKTPSPYRYQIFLFIQMQLCHPATLADWIKERNRRIPESDHSRRVGPALGVFNQIVSGLAHIHAKGT